jgi:hypothetical protein
MARTTEGDHARALQETPNVGPAIARDLLRVFITGRADLVGQDPMRPLRASARSTGCGTFPVSSISTTPS